MYSFGGKSYKHRTFFESFARTVPPVDKGKEKLAIASLNSLTGIFDSDVLEKIRTNPDLLAISSCLALGNYANRNDDAIFLNDLIKVAENFEYKQLNVEHNRADICGVIDEIGWALYPSNELIDEDNITGDDKEVQLVIGGYLWRVVNPELCSAVEEASNENSPNYQKISTSFELLFNDYWVCLSPDRNAKNPNARLIAPEDEDFAKYDKKLKVNGGDGKDGGMLVFRVLRDGILPVGAGIVRNPASGIKGIAVVGPDSELKKEEPEEVEVEKEEGINAGDWVNIKNNRGSDECKWEVYSTNISSVSLYYPEKPKITEFKYSEVRKYKGQTRAQENILENDKEISVNENKSTNTIMVISSINDIEAQFDAFSKLPAKEATASIQKIMETKILELSTEFAAKEKAKDEALANEVKAKADLEARASGLGKAVEELQAKLLEIETKQAAAANEAAFNGRMAALDEVFDLDDDDRSILVEEVKALESEAAFMPWMDKKKKLMKEKTKAYKMEKAKCLEDKMAKAGVKFTLAEDGVNIKEVFASIKEDATEAKIPNTPHLTENLGDKIKALRSGITVAGVKTE